MSPTVCQYFRLKLYAICITIVHTINISKGEIEKGENKMISCAELRRLSIAISILSILILVISCGGGGGGGDSDTPTGTVSGSVSGTSVIVVDDHGKIVASDDTKGRTPNLDLDDDGTNESFSFTITDIPVDVSIRIYLVTGDGVFPMYFDDSSADVNVFSMSSATDINLGFVEIIGSESIPQNNPLNTPDVTADGVDASIIAISGATPQDFVGTWQGTISYLQADGESGNFNATLTLSVSGDSLVGTWDDGAKVDIDGDVASGMLTFYIPTDDPDNPDCANWSFTATAILTSNPTIMDINASGTVCSEEGGVLANASGFLTSSDGSGGIAPNTGSYVLNGSTVETPRTMLNMVHTNPRRLQIGLEYSWEGPQISTTYTSKQAFDDAFSDNTLLLIDDNIIEAGMAKNPTFEAYIRHSFSLNITRNIDGTYDFISSGSLSSDDGTNIITAIIGNDVEFDDINGY
jgi:hypothetical protein